MGLRSTQLRLTAMRTLASSQLSVSAPPRRATCTLAGRGLSPVSPSWLLSPPYSVRQAQCWPRRATACFQESDHPLAVDYDTGKKYLDSNLA